jgi:hypothetical protein
MLSIQPLRIFLSSPGDLFPERDVIKKVIEELNQSPHYQERYKIIAYAYEDRAPAAVGEGAQPTVDHYSGWNLKTTVIQAIQGRLRAAGLLA